MTDTQAVYGTLSCRRDGHRWPPPVTMARGRRRQNVAPRRRWCRTTRKGQSPADLLSPANQMPLMTVETEVRRAHAIQN
jgi:hypothetical protein